MMKAFGKFSRLLINCHMRHLVNLSSFIFPLFSQHPSRSWLIVSQDYSFLPYVGAVDDLLQHPPESSTPRGCKGPRTAPCSAGTVTGDLCPAVVCARNPPYQARRGVCDGAEQTRKMRYRQSLQRAFWARLNHWVHNFRAFT